MMEIERNLEEKAEILEFQKFEKNLKKSKKSKILGKKIKNTRTLWVRRKKKLN